MVHVDCSRFQALFGRLCCALCFAARESPCSPTVCRVALLSPVLDCVALQDLCGSEEGASLTDVRYSLTGNGAPEEYGNRQLSMLPER